MEAPEIAPMRADPLLPAQAYARDVLGSPPRAPSPEHSAHSPIADYVAAQRRARRRLAEEAVQSRRAKDALANPNRRPPWVPAATAGVGALKIASPVNAAWPSAQPSARQQGRPDMPGIGGSGSYPAGGAWATPKQKPATASPSQDRSGHHGGDTAGGLGRRRALDRAEGHTGGGDAGIAEGQPTLSERPADTAGGEMPPSLSEPGGVSPAASPPAQPQPRESSARQAAAEGSRCPPNGTHVAPNPNGVSVAPSPSGIGVVPSPSGIGVAPSLNGTHAELSPNRTHVPPSLNGTQATRLQTYITAATPAAASSPPPFCTPRPFSAAALASPLPGHVPSSSRHRSSPPGGIRTAGAVKKLVTTERGEVAEDELGAGGAATRTGAGGSGSAGGLPGAGGLSGAGGLATAGGSSGTRGLSGKGGLPGAGRSSSACGLSGAGTFVRAFPGGSARRLHAHACERQLRLEAARRAAAESSRAKEEEQCTFHPRRVRGGGSPPSPEPKLAGEERRRWVAKMESEARAAAERIRVTRKANVSAAQGAAALPLSAPATVAEAFRERSCAQRKPVRVMTQR